MGRAKLGLSVEEMKERTALQKKEHRAKKKSSNPEKFMQKQRDTKWIYRQIHPKYALNEAALKRNKRKPQEVPVPVKSRTRLTRKERSQQLRRYFRD